jgi:Uma2 family endonuclease
LIDKYCIVYLNNILVYSQKENEYKEYIKLVLEVLQKEQLYINLKKYKFGVKQVVFCRHLITPKGIYIDPEKIRAILE